jgi:hypothetical protein
MYLGTSQHPEGLIWLLKYLFYIGVDWIKGGDILSICDSFPSINCNSLWWNQTAEWDEQSWWQFWQYCQQSGPAVQENILNSQETLKRIGQRI